VRVIVQDDSVLNRKLMIRLVESESKGHLANAYIREADDGLQAVELLQSEMEAGRSFDVVLMDYVMVCSFMSMRYYVL